MSRRLLKKYQSEQQHEISDKTTNITPEKTEKPDISLFNIFLKLEDINIDDNTSHDEGEKCSSSIVANKNSKKLKKKNKSNKKRLSSPNSPVLETDQVLQPKKQNESDYTVISIAQKENYLIIDPKKVNYIFEDCKMNGYKIDDISKSSKLKKYRIIYPKLEWRTLTNPGIEMKIKSQEGNLIYYQYTYNEKYIMQNNTFYQLILSDNEIGVYDFYKDNSNHIDSILRFAYATFESEPKTSAELIQISLFLLENSKHSTINFFGQNSRLLYIDYENRTFLISLFLHILSVDQKCCYESCFELSKILLNLDPSDPLGILFLIDFYSIKSKSYNWIEYFYQNKKDQYNLHLLPNFRFSLGLAHFFVDKKTSCVDLFCSALLDFPSIMFQIERICSISIDKRIIGHALFQNAYRKTPPFLITLIGIYVDKIKFLLRNAKIMNCLIEAALRATTLYDENITSYELIYEKSKLIYTDYKKPILRYAYLTKYKDEFVNKEMERYYPIIITDPFPPKNSLNPHIKAFNQNMYTVNFSEQLS